MRFSLATKLTISLLIVCYLGVCGAQLGILGSRIQFGSNSGGYQQSSGYGYGGQQYGSPGYGGGFGMGGPPIPLAGPNFGGPGLGYGGFGGPGFGYGGYNGGFQQGSGYQQSSGGYSGSSLGIGIGRR